ncbi:GNAT family N-acetyltransferase [Paenibacillus daejeonensis]|uniref:GNAT family N-acetyltransferase n=1 Tax=Paenibacillus daejeonensis TaxID=135193 RepID=UPI00039EC75B|nr:GNAT family N-acetyltransferase [Paenibacillus daejeonensis]
MMEIIQTFNSELITNLNQEIQTLHRSMVPWRFKEFNFAEINAYFKQVMESPKHLFFIIPSQGGEALGYVWIEIKAYHENAFLHAYQSIFVQHLCVAKAHKNKGLGKQLMNKVMEVAVERGIQRIELDYWSMNEDAKQFYSKLGFEVYREFAFKHLSEDQP